MAVADEQEKEGGREGTLSYLWHQVRNLKIVMD